MILLKTKNYKKFTMGLPKKSREILATQKIFLIESIFHPKLHTKKLKGFPGAERKSGDYLIFKIPS